VKKYVKVIAEFDTNGKITPLEIIWDDDRRFIITHVSDIQRAASHAGGTGYKYTVIIEGKERYLWLENIVFNKVVGAKWFLEVNKMG